MRTIIAGTDFSQSSMNACLYAAFLAYKLNCKLTLFNLFETPVFHSNNGIYALSYTSAKVRSLNKMNKVQAGLHKLFPKIKINQFITSGSFEEEIQMFTRTHKVEIAVMGLDAKNKISRSISASHGIRLAGKIHTPVIIVPSGYRIHQLSKIVLATDNREKLNESSLHDFERFVDQAKCNVNLIHIKTPDEIIEPVGITQKINGKEMPVATLEAQDLQTGIKNYCLDSPADMITIISKRHSVFYNLFAETATKKIASTARIPVMAVHE